MKRLRQFSLRTILLLTVAVAVAAGWWLRPKLEMREFPGGVKFYETLQAQSESQQQRRGSFAIQDPHRRIVGRGKFLDDKPSGWWTYYHDNGRMAERGPCLEGVATGTWQSWYANGRRKRLVHYGPPRLIVMNIRNPIEVEARSVAWTPENEAEFYKAWNQTSPMRPVALDADVPLVVSARHGDYQSWWPDGILQSQGQFDLDQRTGTWTFWTRTGQKRAEGTYDHDVRSGTWHFWDGGAAPREVFFIAGRQFPPLKELLPELNQALVDGNREQRFRASKLLSQIGDEGNEGLLVALRSDDLQLVIDTVRRLRDHPRSAPILAELDQLTTSKDPRLSGEVHLTLAMLDEPERRTAHLRNWILLTPTDEDYIDVHLALLVPHLRIELLDDLAILIDDPEPVVRLDAFFALLSLYGPTMSFGPTLYMDATFQAVDHVRVKRLAELIQKCQDHPDPLIAERARNVLKNPQPGGVF